MQAKTKNKRKNNAVLGRLRHAAKMTVVPHKKNGYRPHLIRSYGLAAVVFVVIGLQVGYGLAVKGNVLGKESAITVSELLERTNRERTNVGETALALNDALNRAAYLKAQDMFAKQYWSHESPDGVRPWKWLGDVGYNYDVAGENLAKNFATTDAAVLAWMNSPEHRSNILKSDYQDVGFAVVDGTLSGQPTSLIVAFYGRKADNAESGITRSFLSANTSVRPDILSQFAVATLSMNVMTMTALGLISVTIITAVYAHKHRHKLTGRMKKTWYRHHGLYKSIGMTVFGLVVIFWSVGQI